MFERFTERARRVVVLAQEESRLLRHDYIGTEHILLGLLREEEGLAARVLEEMDFTVEEVRAHLARIVGQGDEVTTGQIPFTPSAKRVLELSLREAVSLGHNYIGTEHILLGLVRENDGVAARILLDFDADAEKIRNEIIRMLSGSGRLARSSPDPTSVDPPSPLVELTSPPLAQEVIDKIDWLRQAGEAAMARRSFHDAARFADDERRLRSAAADLVRAWQRHMGKRT